MQRCVKSMQIARGPSSRNRGGGDVVTWVVVVVVLGLIVGLVEAMVQVV